MARVVQVGTVETCAPYNRTLVKQHVQVKLAAEGQSEAETLSVLHVVPQLSAGALCIGGKCAMWRWAEKAPMMVKVKTWAAPEGLTDEELVAGEPTRPGTVPLSAVWLPVENIDTEDSSGGYWIESDEDAQKRIEAITNSRQGYCGIAGRSELL